MKELEDILPLVDRAEKWDDVEATREYFEQYWQNRSWKKNPLYEETIEEPVYDDIVGTAGHVVPPPSPPEPTPAIPMIGMKPPSRSKPTIYVQIIIDSDAGRFRNHSACHDVSLGAMMPAIQPVIRLATSACHSASFSLSRR